MNNETYIKHGLDEAEKFIPEQIETIKQFVIQGNYIEAYHEVVNLQSSLLSYLAVKDACFGD